MHRWTFMKSAAVATVLSLSAVAAHADTVIFSKQGMIHADSFTTLVELAGAGTYDVTFSSSANADVTFNFGYESHWDVFRAPPPRPHSEYITGSNQFNQTYNSGIGTSFNYTFVVPEDYKIFFLSDSYYELYGVPLGTELYYDQRYYSASIRTQVWPSSFDDGTYSVTITQRDAIDPNAGVPEPSAWALMILGFATVGGALRRRVSLTA